MSTETYRSVDDAIRACAGSDVTVRRGASVGGGCINRTSRIELSNGTCLFLKENDASLPNLFREEARGLNALSSSEGPRVPAVIAHGGNDKGQFLLLEHISTGRRGPGFAERLGRELANLHRTGRADRAGFSADNYIGATPQNNDRRDSWASFFGECRILPQIELAVRRGRADRSMATAAEALVGRLADILPEPEGGFHLLHGDLWGGNYMVGPDGEPVLIDPAVYYGHREADIAMTELFGGFPGRFYDAYREAFPLDRGYAARRDIYNLYHLLNHLNLFGGGYRGQCMSILAPYRRER